MSAESISGLDQALKAVGGPSALSKSFQNLGVTISSQAIGQWDVVPPARVLMVEQITGVSRHRLRPDIYGPEPERQVRGRTHREALAAR